MRKRTLCNPNQPTEIKQPDEQFANLQEEIAFQSFSSSSFLSINKALLRHYGLEVAAILGNLIDKRKYFRGNFPNNDGWFFLTHQQQCNQLGVTEYGIRRCKKILKEDGVLKMKQMGIPAKEWYKINIWTLVTVLDQDLTKTQGQGLIDSGGLIKENRIKENESKEKRKDISLTDKKNPDKTKKPPIKERNEKYLPLAMHLARTIQSNKNIKFSVNQINTWTNEIRQLVETNGVTYSRIQNSLDWYEIHINDQYVPVIESGSSLRSKFIKLEAAMERNQTVSKGSKRLGAAQSDDAPYPVDCIVEE